MDGREALIRDFLSRHGWDDAERRPLADDASFRRYDRLRRNDDRAVLMDAPPPQEDVRPFVSIAGRLRALGFSAPAVIASDVPAGLLLLEDLGDATFTRILAAGGDEAALYTLAMDVLIALHERFDPAAAADVPPYDDERLLQEAALFVDWYLPAVRGAPTAETLRRDYLDLWRAAFPAARRTPPTLVLRDYHVDNLMVVDGRSGVGGCGLLDFQDAVIGPAAYDVVSLLEDARRDVSPDLAARLRARYRDAFPAVDPADFAASYAVLGAQRSAKILGIFTRLDRRDGKPVYLRHIPRVWRWLEDDLRHPALAALRDWFDAASPAGERIAPAPGAAT